MTVLRVDDRDREREDVALAGVVRAFLLAVGKWVENRKWVVLKSDVTGQWSLDIDGEPVLTDLPLSGLAEAI